MEGYSKIAKMMSGYSELAILRRFGELNLQDLLYSQAEIIHLNDELQEIATRDCTFPGREFYTKDWWSLANTEDDHEKDQWQKVLQIRSKLREYSAC